jgi:hypothetical protein
MPPSAAGFAPQAQSARLNKIRSNAPVIQRPIHVLHPGQPSFELLPSTVPTCGQPRRSRPVASRTTHYQQSGSSTTSVDSTSSACREQRECWLPYRRRRASLPDPRRQRSARNLRRLRPRPQRPCFSRRRMKPIAAHARLVQPCAAATALNPEHDQPD